MLRTRASEGDSASSADGECHPIHLSGCAPHYEMYFHIRFVPRDLAYSRILYNSQRAHITVRGMEAL
jgi:hypothetical protein